MSFIASYLLSKPCPYAFYAWYITLAFVYIAYTERATTLTVEELG